jgi:hypothetical protein
MAFFLFDKCNTFLFFFKVVCSELLDALSLPQSPTLEKVSESITKDVCVAEPPPKDLESVLEKYRGLKFF